MAEWSIAAVLKTVELRGSGGSNPSLSAKKKEFRMELLFFFVRSTGPSRILATNSVRGIQRAYNPLTLEIIG